VKPVVAPLSSVGIQLTAETGTTNITHELPVVCAIVEMNVNDYDVILPSNVLKELHQVPVVSVNVVETPHTCSSDVESIVDCDRSYPHTVVQNSAGIADGNDDVLNAEYDNDMAQITDNESYDAATSSVLINEQKRDETVSLLGYGSSRQRQFCDFSRYFVS